MNKAIPPTLSNVPKTSVLAISSLVLGILSPVCLFAITGIPAVICGHMARVRIRASDGKLTGNGLAIGGLATGYLGIALTVIIPLLMLSSIPKQVKAREAAMRTACTNNLQLIHDAKLKWATEHADRAHEVPSKEDLLPYLPEHRLPACPARGDYSIKPVGLPPECVIPSHKLNPQESR